MHWASSLLILTVASSYVAASPNLLNVRQGDDHGRGRGGNDGDDNDDGPSNVSNSTSPAVSNSTSPASSGNSTSGLTGGSVCSSLMCVSAIVNGSTTEYTLQTKNVDTLGWMAMGFGTQMANTPMVIMWANSDGSMTLSQRKAPQEVMPTVDPSPPRVATAEPSKSQLTGTNASFVYTIPSDSETSQNIIWAFGTINPDNSAVDAPLMQHTDSGALTLPLSNAIDVSSNGTVAPPPTTGGGEASVPLLSYEKKMIAHGILSTIGFLGLLPLGAILARYFRTFTPVWFQGHWIVQFALAGPVIISGVALGFSAVHDEGGPALDDDHMRWGLAIFVLYFLQIALGAVIHFFKPRSSVENRRRPLQNYFHAVFGLLIIALSFYQVRTGYRTEYPEATGRTIANGANIVWYIWVVLIPVIYFAGLALLPRQFKQERVYKLDNNSNRDMSQRS